MLKSRMETMRVPVKQFWRCCLVAVSMLFVRRARTEDDSAAVTWRGSGGSALDREDVGVKEKWFKRDLADRIKLPGILQAQGYGDDITTDTPWVAALPRDMRWYLLPQYQAYTKPGNIKIHTSPSRQSITLAWPGTSATSRSRGMEPATRGVDTRACAMGDNGLRG